MTQTAIDFETKLAVLRFRQSQLELPSDKWRENGGRCLPENREEFDIILQDIKIISDHYKWYLQGIIDANKR